MKSQMTPDPRPDWVCYHCGTDASGHYPHEGATWHLGVCHICRLWLPVTEPRDFTWDPFEDSSCPHF